jgi:hypothetical protein
LRQIQSESETLKSENMNLENKIKVNRSLTILLHLIKEFLILKDLELELSRSKESITIENLTRESDKVFDLESKNRKLMTEVEYLKFVARGLNL